MPAIIVCADCQTKLKVPDNSTAKALRCPKCKGVVPVKTEKAAPAPAKPAAVKAAAKPVPAKAPAKDEEEFEVNEAAEEEEEFEVNEAADDGEDNEKEDPKQEIDDDSPLAELGFAKVKDVFKKGNIPDAARKAIEKTFVKNEKALWAGRPSKALCESKAWIGLIVGPIAILFGLSVCIVTAVIPIDNITYRLIAIGFGVLFALMFGVVGVLAILFRKRIGGNIENCYVLTNKRVYIHDGTKVHAFTAHQIDEMHTEASTSFEGAGDLIFGYYFMGQEGVLVNKLTSDLHGHKTAGSPPTPMGFLNIEDLQVVRAAVEQYLIEPAGKKAKKKKKKR